MSRPIAVLIADVHYSLSTLELADTAMQQAIDKANYLEVPVIVAGDLHDTKANLRGECVNVMLKTFECSDQLVYIIVGNHDRLNEKAPAHALNFLSSIQHLTLVDRPHFYNELGSINGNSIHLIPYHHDPDELRQYLKKVDPNSCIIMHQGIEGSNSGDYIQDKSAIAHNDIKDFRVISGHYHVRQDIKTGRPRKGAVGLWSYIGNPYTVNFGEANDPTKGYQILMNDGTLEFVPTNLRKHIKIEIKQDNGVSSYDYKTGDLVWVKVYGDREYLATMTKAKISQMTGIPNFKLEKIATDVPTAAKASYSSQPEQLDSILDQMSPNDKITQNRRKELWRAMCE